MIPIDRDVPIPRNGAHEPYLYPFKDMAIGDSFLFPDIISRDAAGARASVAGKRLGRRFITRMTPKGTRCWRVG